MNGAGSFPCTVDFHAIKLGHRLQHRAGIHPQVPFDGAALPFFPFVLPVFFFLFYFRDFSPSIPIITHFWGDEWNAGPFALSAFLFGVEFSLVKFSDLILF